MRKTMAALVLCVLALALSGCIFTAPEATLYRLPKLAGEYESLEARIDALLAMGGEYAALLCDEYDQWEKETAQFGQIATSAAEEVEG